MRTQGKIILDVHRSIVLETDGGWVVNIGHADYPADAQTWAIAHNAANAIDAMGLDGDKAIELLPELVKKWSGKHKNRSRSYRIDALNDAIVFENFMQSITKDKTDV